MELKKLAKILKEWEENITLEENISLENCSEDIDMAIHENMVQFYMQKIQHNKKTLVEIKNALKKIALGTYGICEESGEEIGIERLKANPIARYSLEAQIFFENMNKKTKIKQQHLQHNGDLFLKK